MYFCPLPSSSSCLKCRYHTQRCSSHLCGHDEKATRRDLVGIQAMRRVLAPGLVLERLLPTASV